MKAVTILGGLGSQMWKYAFYLKLKEISEDKCIIDTTPFVFQPAWNGYELEKLFGIKGDEDLKDLTGLSEAELKDKYGTYQQCVLQELTKIDGTDKVSYFFRGNRELRFLQESGASYVMYKIGHGISWRIKALLDKTGILPLYASDNVYPDRYPKNYASISGSVYYDEFCAGDGRYFPDREELKKVFTFPDFDEKNAKVADEMKKINSVAVHIRRSDHMHDNGDLFETGYFKKAIEHIKANDKALRYYIFSDEPAWCQENLAELGLDETDIITYVDWNRGQDSYKDMQLMTYAKHNILPISAFSWWGQYLSVRDRQEKIVVAPKHFWFDATVHF